MSSRKRKIRSLSENISADEAFPVDPGGFPVNFAEPFAEVIAVIEAAFDGDA